MTVATLRVVRRMSRDVVSRAGWLAVDEQFLVWGLDEQDPVEGWLYRSPCRGLVEQ